jgi:purine-binding chemotaxis protein CheW
MKQYCTFLLEGQLFGLEVSEVQEVIRYQDMTTVPLSHDTICGLINLRGQIVTAIDLRRMLEYPELDHEARPMNIVVKHDGLFASLLVDEIGEVLEVDDNAFEGVPETLQGVARELVLGAYKLKTNLLLVLDIGTVLNVEDITAD